MAVDPKSPNNREEMYLAKAAGEGTTIPEEPWSRKEAYLNKIAGGIDGIGQDIDDLSQKVAALATDFSYKGSVEDYAHLPSGPAVGDVYTTEDKGEMYVWDGTQWQILNMTGSGGGVVELTTADTATYPGPTGTNGLGLWRLPTGIYKLQGITGYAKNDASITNLARPGALVMVSNDANNPGVFYTILCISGNNNEPGWFYDTISGRFNRVYLATSTGQNTDRGMTQKAITDVTTGLDTRLTTVEGELTGLESALNTINNGTGA